MVKNPYEVLGVANNATDEQIKTAYRELAKKYHPDKYANSPLKDVANEKMQEINEAYDTIVDMRKNQSSSNQTQAQSYSYQTNRDPQFSRIRSYIMSGNVDIAEKMLDEMDDFSRTTAEWYFLKGMVCSRRGWNEQAFQFIEKAVQLDPSNPEYNAAYSNLVNSRRYGATRGYDNTASATGCGCLEMCICSLCMNACCNCCGGGC